MAQGIDAKALLARMLEFETVSVSEQQEIHSVFAGEDKIELPKGMTDDGGDESLRAAFAPLKDDGEQPPQISKLRLPEKIKLAMFGNGYARSVLIRDPNRMVQVFVLKNPRIQGKEIEEFSRNPNLSEHVLRVIAMNDVWTKSYQVKVNLVCNPKTPSDQALRWLRYLNVPELRRIAKSRDLPQVVVTVARKRLEETARK